MTVEEFFSDINANLIEEKIEKSESSNIAYWEKVADFWQDVKGKPADKISAKQRSWLERIQEDLHG